MTFFPQERAPVRIDKVRPVIFFQNIHSRRLLAIECCLGSYSVNDVQRTPHPRRCTRADHQHDPVPSTFRRRCLEPVHALPASRNVAEHLWTHPLALSPLCLSASLWIRLRLLVSRSACSRRPVRAPGLPALLLTALRMPPGMLTSCSNLRVSG